MNVLSPILLLALVFGSVRAGQATARSGPGRPGWAVFTLIALVALPSVVQLLVPGLLSVLGRQTVEITQHGQDWRLLTAILVQDGGWLGTLLNLAILVITVPVAARVWGGWSTLLIFLLGGVALNVLAVHFGADGAGNSGATLALGSSLVARALVLRRAMPWVLLAVLAAFGLLLIGDAHWIAAALGLLAGGGLSVTLGHRHPPTTPAEGDRP